MNIWTSQHDGTESVPGPALSERDLEEEVLWPFPPEWTVRFALDEQGWLLDIEIATDEDGAHHVTGIVVRSGVPTTRDGSRQEPFQKGAEYLSLEPREVQRLPLTRYTRAALMIVEDPFATAGRREIRQVQLPQGRPTDQPGPAFYADLLVQARELESQGIRPVPEIAKRKRVSQNVVHQWLHRARKLEAASPTAPSLGPSRL